MFYGEMNQRILISQQGVNFTNILCAVFAPIMLRPKRANLKCKYKKASSKTFVQIKLRVKCWWNLPKADFSSSKIRDWLNFVQICQEKNGFKTVSTQFQHSFNTNEFCVLQGCQISKYAATYYIISPKKFLTLEKRQMKGTIFFE